MRLRNLVLSLILSVTPAYADQTGVRFSQLDAPHHGKPMDVAVWYPVDDHGNDSGRMILFAENPVFYGFNVLENASVAAGRHPLVMLSHGMGGRLQSLAGFRRA